MHLYPKRESPCLPRTNCPHPNHTLAQHLAVSIIDLDEHRILPWAFGAGMSNDAIDAEGTDGLSGSHGGDRVEAKAALTCRAAYSAPENRFSAVGTTPPLSLNSHGRSPFERVATCQEGNILGLTLFPPERDVPTHL